MVVAGGDCRARLVGAAAQQGKAAPGFSSTSLRPYTQPWAASNWGRPEKCCLGRGELDERGKYHF